MSRRVFLMGRYAVKVPSLRHGPQFFVRGMLANMLEAERWKLSQHPSLTPVYLSLPFGPLNVAKRYDRLIKRLLTREEVAQLPFINFDNNGHNAAWDGVRVVLIDYGNVDMYLCLEPTP